VIQVRGMVAAINAALDGLIFAPLADYNGSTSIAVLVDDLGNTGGGSQTATQMISVVVHPVDEPVIAPPPGSTTSDMEPDDFTEEELEFEAPPPETAATGGFNVQFMQTDRADEQLSYVAVFDIQSSSIPLPELVSASNQHDGRDGPSHFLWLVRSESSVTDIRLVDHVDPVTREPTLLYEMQVLGQELDDLREDLVEENSLKSFIVGSTSTVSFALSVGYAIWSLRSGYFLATLLSSMPAWRTLDPLPVLSSMLLNTGSHEERENRDQSLQDLVVHRSSTSAGEARNSGDSPSTSQLSGKP
ncbi:MAG: hypothetical protein KDA74_24825, partial [Planctomycetaceae bacterium]|nr:hypothetical protein [Planctomycetaceae bacterium]